MVKYNLTAGTQIIELEKMESPNFLIFKGITSSCYIKAEIQRVGSDNEKLIPTMQIVKLHEAQQKIKTSQ